MKITEITKSPEITKSIQIHKNHPKSQESAKYGKYDIRDCAGDVQKAWKPFVNAIENQPGEAGAARRCPGSIKFVEISKISSNPGKYLQLTQNA